MDEIRNNLGIGVAFVKGQKTPVRKCWHFYTDGKAVDVMFYDDRDFAAGLNRIHVVLQDYEVIILAFCLMDTHIHFVLYGEFDECNRFIHEYLRRTSAAISLRHGDRSKLQAASVGYQVIKDDGYLKTVICYVIKNPTTAGMKYCPTDYPWSSGPLYFRSSGFWCSPPWSRPGEDGLLRYHGTENLADLPVRDRRSMLRTRQEWVRPAQVVDGTVFPGAFVRSDLVEEVFRTHRSFQYFVGRTKDDDVEFKDSFISYLSVPVQEMRQHKNELCMKMFGEKTVKKLSVHQRLKLARRLRSGYQSSPRQIARLCGLVYDEVKDKLD
ncbi:MAG: hypothetical protein MJY88_06705 [Bacteroidales bacterium]|nr:hypothetical protein [Bacteroidales bacterium]